MGQRRVLASLLSVARTRAREFGESGDTHTDRWLRLLDTEEGAQLAVRVMEGLLLLRDWDRTGLHRHGTLDTLLAFADDVLVPMLSALYTKVHHPDEWTVRDSNTVRLHAHGSALYTQYVVIWMREVLLSYHEHNRLADLLALWEKGPAPLTAEGVQRQRRDAEASENLVQRDEGLIFALLRSDPDAPAVHHMMGDLDVGMERLRARVRAYFAALDQHIRTSLPTENE